MQALAKATAATTNSTIELILTPRPPRWLRRHKKPRRLPSRKIGARPQTEFRAARASMPGRPGLGAVPTLRKWNERPGQLVIVRDGFFFCCCGARQAVDGAFQVDAFGRDRCTRQG